MVYFSERHGFSQPKIKTPIIDVKKYSLLFDCVEKRFNNLAYKFPDICPHDLKSILGLDYDKFYNMVSYEIGNIYKDTTGKFVKPANNWRPSRPIIYDQYALLNLIEYVAVFCKDFEINGAHNFFNHYHLTFFDSNLVFKAFQKDINDIFETTGLTYVLNDDKKIERLLGDDLSTQEVLTNIEKIDDNVLRNLIKEGILLYLKPNPVDRRLALDKLWDALERIKTHYEAKKIVSVNKVIDTISLGENHYKELFDEEFTKLTSIGNDFQIRHFERGVYEIIDERHFEYFFNRCLALVSMVIKFLH